MPYVKILAEGKSVADKTKVIYNPQITILDIPIEAYDYIVNGKPALEWVMERQSFTTDKDSGILNDANLWPATASFQSAISEIASRIAARLLDPCKGSRQWATRKRAATRLA